MESNFFNEDIEDFIKRNADGMRMRPSDKVWEGISGRLQKRRRRVAFATSAFVLLSSFLGYFLIDNTKELPGQIVTSSSEIKETSNQISTNHSLSNTSTTEAKIEAKVIDIKKTGKVPVVSKKSLAPVRELKRNTSSHSVATTDIQEEMVDQPQLDASLSADSTATSFTPTIIDSELAPADRELTTSEEKEEPQQKDVTEQVAGIESVTNLYQPSIKKSKLGFQVFFTPTVSYRKLSENKSYLRSVTPGTQIPNSPGIQEDVNDAVTHKPDMGLEFGLAAKYPIAKNIKIRGGLQFNINRYDIKAFKYSTEIATIALNRNDNSGGVDYIGAVTDYRNYNGFRADWLQNFYFQVSAPIGAELRIYSNKKAHFGVAGTVQPTYLIGERAYLLSSDYKNYSEVPWLTRHWNVNTAIETFVSYSTGKMQWQVGPQVRYQLLSSFVTKYPLKENLFDFGFKIGVSINKNTTEQPK